jgi:hypothetical protein
VEWCEEAYVEVPASACVDGVCCDSSLAPLIVGPEVVYYTIVAFNAVSESPWEHGERISCED